ncbi:MAG: arsenite methyltransferase [Deferribacteres bacterium]|jgi:MoaA/NifB/PqqE/SkfB family radical SAM enzyme/SAM-dependent methyltransferase|nr:arsenite methyltransferase [Deferribacteres bacterium]
MQEILNEKHRLKDYSWNFTENGEMRAYVTPTKLKELWFHTGTICNLRCPFCFEGSSPNNNRIEQLTLSDIKPFIEEALEIGVERFSFTGGEPFVNKEFIKILDYALNFKDCLVLTNATEPLLKNLDKIKSFANKPNKLTFRVSLDSYDETVHDKNRGKGKFKLSLELLKKIYEMGFDVSVASQASVNESISNINENFAKLFNQSGLLETMEIVSFVDLKRPGAAVKVPEITKAQLYSTKSDEEIENLMCSYSKMVLKKDGKVSVYACTLVDDDEQYDLGSTLKEAMQAKVSLKHHRCFICYSDGVSCSQLSSKIAKKQREEGMITKEAAVNKDDIKEYYGKVLKTKYDLKTSACCSTESVPDYVKSILLDIEEEILDKFYGCGSPIPLAVEGCTVIDLGCGTGRDAYILSRLVGENGKVIGVDMTDEQLDVAKKYIDLMTEKFGFKSPNIEFKKGYIEELDKLGIEDNSVDVVISNCVVNLSFDKSKLLKEIFRVLKPGGELYFSDVFASRRIPDELKTDPVLIGECIAGAFYIEDFRRAVARLGYPEVRVVSSREIEINNPEIKQKVGMAKLYSRTVRVFKIEDLEDRCEDYGQVAIYLGTIPQEPNFFMLDDHHIFEKGKPMLVCGNTASMLSQTRYSKHFKVFGDRSTHYGLFDCGDDKQNNDEPKNACGC